MTLNPDLENDLEADDVHVGALLAPLQGAVGVEQGEQVRHQGEEGDDGGLDQQHPHGAGHGVEAGQLAAREVPRREASSPLVGGAGVAPVCVCNERPWKEGGWVGPVVVKGRIAQSRLGSNCHPKELF